MRTELIRMTVRCENTGNLIDVDYEEANIINNSEDWGGHVFMTFKCQLCGKQHNVNIM